MASFRGSDFELQLPSGYSDESTYAFVFPTRTQIRPSVVVKTERLAAPTELPAYVEKQLGTIRSALTDLTVVESGPAAHGNLTAYFSVFDWGEPQQRVRQKQHYVLLDNPARVVTLTATSSREAFSQVEALFDAIFLSFKPLGPQGERE